MKLRILNISQLSGNILLTLISLICVLGLWGCYPSLKKVAQRPEQALIQVKSFYPDFHDDMDFDSIANAVESNLEYLNRLDPEYTFYYGPHKFTCRHVRESQEKFLEVLLNSHDSKELKREIKKNFLVYRAAGRVGNRSVLFTGYFEPIYEAKLSPDETYRYPIYNLPDNLIRIDLSLFRDKFKGENIIGRIKGKSVLPYYSREEIEDEKALNGKNLEIAWLKDPVDVAFLHIQGSGRLKLPDDSMIPVGYRGSNGWPYHSIGRYMLDRGYMDEEEMSMQGIRAYLSDHPEVIDEVLNHNPSYVFFRLLDKGPLGNIGVPLTPGRSIALDSGIFPRGAICFISSEKPVISSSGKIENWTGFSRFVVNQDTGGAIKGAGRADIFWGSDQYAQLAAGHMQHEGDLYILIKKP
ncbi:MltA domain-containing protein [Deltaproteobacteria bacterium]|nr:MltA domain-containing protein [Deltaproteobacteria bacterium]